MSPLAMRVWRTIRRYQMVTPATRVLVAVSGGGDSVGLVHLLGEILAAIPPEQAFEVVGLAHVNHGIRGEAAAADEQFCADLGRRLGIPVHVRHVDVPRVAAASGHSLEDAARRVRYEVLEDVRRASGADVVAVGHTRDDQAETVLLQLARGAGTRGIGGIHPRTDRLVRPLLEVGGAEVREWLTARGERWVEDATNADTRLRRNAVRHKVLPPLRDAFGPGVGAVLARHANVARADEELLASLARAAWERAAVATPAGPAVDWAVLSGEPLALRRRVLLELLRQGGVRQPGFDQVEALGRVADGTSAALVVGRVRAERNGSHVVLSDRGSCAGGPHGGFRYLLPVPGHVRVPEASVSISAAHAAKTGAVPPVVSSRIVIDAAAARGHLGVRSWRAGDAIRPLGLGGRKKLQDLFVDRHVPRETRSTVPLVVDGEDRILWVAGHAIDEACRVTERTMAVVVLSLTDLGGPS